MTGKSYEEKYNAGSDLVVFIEISVFDTQSTDEEYEF